MGVAYLCYQKGGGGGGGEELPTYHMSIITFIQDFQQANVARRQSYDGRLIRRIFRNPWND